MATNTNIDLTALLRRAGEGDRAAANEAFDVLYSTLRANARFLMRSRGDNQTLDSHGVIHEAFIKVSASGKSDWESRGHFLAVMSKAMRQVLLDDAKRKRRRRHGGELQRVPLADVVLDLGRDRHRLGSVHDGLASLESKDADASRLLELTYFVGLTASETAEALGVSESTVVRDLKWARTLLRAEIGP